MTRIILVLLAVVLFSCNKKNKTILNNEEMANVIFQVHILEEKVKEVGVQPYEEAQDVYEHYEEKLFDSLKITKSQYETSFNYYLDHPKEFNKIYASVIDTLKSLEKSAESLNHSGNLEVSSNP